jgi:hypothetical protein
MHGDLRKEKPRKNEQRALDYCRAGVAGVGFLADDGLGLANGDSRYVCGNNDCRRGKILCGQERAEVLRPLRQRVNVDLNRFWYFTT